MIKHRSHYDLMMGADQHWESGVGLGHFYIELWFRGRVTKTQMPWGVKTYWKQEWKYLHFRTLDDARAFFEDQVRAFAVIHASRALDV